MPPQKPISQSRAPSKLMTDNGTNFTSKAFLKLMKKYGITHVKCAPHYHEGDGASEKSFETLKRKEKTDRLDISRVKSLQDNGPPLQRNSFTKGNPSILFDNYNFSNFTNSVICTCCILTNLLDNQELHK